MAATCPPWPYPGSATRSSAATRSPKASTNTCPSRSTSASWQPWRGWRPLRAAEGRRRARTTSNVAFEGLCPLAPEDLHDRPQRVGLGGQLVRPVALHAREAQGQTRRIARRLLQVAEGDLDHDLGPDVHDVAGAAGLQGQQRLR